MLRGYLFKRIYKNKKSLTVSNLQPGLIKILPVSDPISDG
jgi:hypothetical protein